MKRLFQGFDIPKRIGIGKDWFGSPACLIRGELDMKQFRGMRLVEVLMETKRLVDFVPEGAKYKKISGSKNTLVKLPGDVILKTITYESGAVEQTTQRMFHELIQETFGPDLIIKISDNTSDPVLYYNTSQLVALTMPVIFESETLAPEEKSKLDALRDKWKARSK